MNKIKLGTICKTNNDKSFEDADGKYFIKKGTYVTVCDDDDIDKGFVLVESEGLSTVFGFLLTELTPLDD